MSSKLKVIFAGTPDFAASVLQAILQSDHEVIACYTQPDRPAGRGRKLTPSPVKALALEHNVPVFQPINFKDPEDLNQLQQLQADIMVVVAYGLLLPKAVLDAPKLGCINVHASLLPRWRGAAPIQRAIAAGDKESGVTIMQMDVGLDTGDMLLKSTTPISEKDTGGSLHDRLAQLGAKDTVKALDLISQQKQQAEPQNNELANYAHKLSKQEARLDWQKSAQDLNNLVRAFNPWPVCHTELDGETVRIWGSQTVMEDSDKAPGTIVALNKDSIDVACGQGILRINELQLSGAKRLSAAALLNSKADRFGPGTQFH